VCAAVQVAVFWASGTVIFLTVGVKSRETGRPQNRGLDRFFSGGGVDLCDV
jgi:hypothetical protein